MIQSRNFFKQKTAYELSASLVGSEMCIRDRSGTAALAAYQHFFSQMGLWTFGCVALIVALLAGARLVFISPAPCIQHPSRD